MSKNDKTINEINEMSGAALAEIESREYKPFNVSDVDLDGNDLRHKEILFNSRSRRSFLELLRVRDDFPELGESISRDRWEAAFKVIKETRRDQQLYAQYGVEDDNSVVVQAIFPKKPSQDNVIRHRSIFASICRSLEETEKEFALSDFHFDRRMDSFDVTLQEPKPLLVGVDDAWNCGARFVFSEMEFSYMPYLERLTCSNGASTLEYGFKSRVDQKKHSIVKVAAIVRKAIIDGTPEIEQRLRHAIAMMQTTNASVLEYDHAKRAIKGALEGNEELFEQIESRYFNDDHISQAYGVILKDQTSKWKGMADCGYTAYSLFNLMTWIASHQKLTGVDRRSSLGIQVAASKFLFKLPLDLRDIPQMINPMEPRVIPEMN